MKPMAVLSFIFGLALMTPGLSIANDATSSSPPGVTMESAGGVPTPPVCNTNTQKLHWNGSGWQCIAVGAASSVTGYAKGSVVSGPHAYSGIYNNYSCPAGQKVMITERSYNTGMSTQPGYYQCIKN